METLTRNDLTALLETEHPCCVTLTMPTHRTGGPESREDATRFSNLIRRTASALEETTCSASDQEQMLAVLESLRHDREFWQHQGDGLAMFLAGHKQQIFRLPMRLRERVVVGPRFDIRQLIPLLQGNGRFYVLAASQNRVRLLEGNRFAAREIADDALPKNLREALNIDEYVQSLQHQSMMGADIGGGPRGAAVYHGHGGGDMSVKKSDELLQYFRRIDSALGEVIGAERAPLVFAGVEYLFPIFREAGKHVELVEEPVPGNHDALSVTELYERAWPLVESKFLAARDKELDRFFTSDNPSSHDTAEILEAARIGRVGVLFLADDGIQAEGRTPSPDPVAPVAEQSGLSADLGQGEEWANLAAVETLRNGGRVFMVPADRLPQGSPLAARFRYALEHAGAAT